MISINPIVFFCLFVPAVLSVGATAGFFAACLCMAAKRGGNGE